jgi:hypothetical protein
MAWRNGYTQFVANEPSLGHTGSTPVAILNYNPIFFLRYKFISEVLHHCCKYHFINYFLSSIDEFKNNNKNLNLHIA